MVAFAAAPVVPRRVPSLYEVFQTIPDPREKQGQRYPLAGLLMQVVTASLCGHHTLVAIAQYGQERKDLARLLGCPKRKTPYTATLHYLFKGLDSAAFGKALSDWYDLNRAEARHVTVHKALPSACQ